MQTSEIKLIALDIDGTIMKKDYTISERVISAITSAVQKGIYVVVATGRMYSATVPVGKILNLITPLITYQGSMVREFYKSDKILLHYSVDTELAYNVIEDLRSENIHINVYCDDKLFVEEENQIIYDYAKDRNIDYIKINRFEELKNFTPTKILGLNYDIKKIDKIKNSLKKKYLDYLNITKSTEYFCEFVNKNCSKANAVLFLAEKEGICLNEIMAIGDQDNDKDMLEIAGIAVAMGNGDAELKEIADFVTETVANDGAALAIEKFILE